MRKETLIIEKDNFWYLKKKLHTLHILLNARLVYMRFFEINFIYFTQILINCFGLINSFHKIHKNCSFYKFFQLKIIYEYFVQIQYNNL